MLNKIVVRVTIFANFKQKSELGRNPGREYLVRHDGAGAGCRLRGRRCQNGPPAPLYRLQFNRQLIIGRT